MSKYGKRRLVRLSTLVLALVATAGAASPPPGTGTPAATGTKAPKSAAKAHKTGPKAPKTGDELLARAATAKGLKSYTVPVEFQVHLERPVGVRSGVDGTANFQSPGEGALVITHATGIIGGFFKGTYHLDLVPQAWPAKYDVLAVSQATDNGVAVTVLTAKPKTGGEDVKQAVFKIGGAHDRAPVAATWTYTDGSTIALTFTNGRVGRYLLPTSATVSVDMKKYKLDATAKYGAYALNAAIDPHVFATK